MRRGFTIVEMLVVITIVAILSSLLLPSLQNGVQRAKGIACANNLCQAAIALNCYGTDARGWIPGPSVHINGNNLPWTLFLTDFPAVDRPVGTAYVNDVAMFYCPSMHAATNQTYLKWDNAFPENSNYCTYGMLSLSYGKDWNPTGGGTISSATTNWIRILGHDGGWSTFYRLSRAKPGGRIPCVAEASLQHPSQKKFMPWCIWMPKYAGDWDGLPHLRHARAANFLYFDGHVAPHGAEQIFFDLDVGNAYDGNGAKIK